MSVVSGKNGKETTYNLNSKENRDMARDIGLDWFRSLSAKKQKAFINAVASRALVNNGMLKSIAARLIV